MRRRPPAFRWLEKAPPMSTHQIPDIFIVDWGKPGAPMVIISDGTALILDPPDPPTSSHDACVRYSTYNMPASPGLNPEPKSVHLGFYGYLRVCNSLCLAKIGMSVFDLADATWRDWYDDRLPPRQAVDEALADNHFLSGEEQSSR
jgi:hypothetical protein